MPMSMHQAAIPVLVRALENLSAVLAKAAEHAEANKIDPAVLVGARLYPDMFPLSRQVQIATDVAKGGAARLAGLPIPAYEDKEATFADLRARIAKTVEFLRSAPAAQVDGTEAKEIAIKSGGQDRTFRGDDYLRNFVLPNVFFHSSTAYAILRHNGVKLGKGDFLGNL